MSETPAEQVEGLPAVEALAEKVEKAAIPGDMEDATLEYHLGRLQKRERSKMSGSERRFHRQLYVEKIIRGIRSGNGIRTGVVK